MNVFNLHRQLIADYAAYTNSFIRIRDQRVRAKVTADIQAGLLWPEPLLQLNPSFEPGAWIHELVTAVTRVLIVLIHGAPVFDSKRRKSCTLST